MFDALRHHTRKRDESPGTAVYSGTAKGFSPQLLCVDYSPDAMTEQVVPFPFSLPAQEEGTSRLLLLTGLHEAEQVQALAEQYGMHPLAVEDVLNTGHRPSMDEYDDHVVIALRHIEYDRNALRLREHHVALLCREGVVIGFHEEQDGIWDGVLNRLRKGKGRIRKFGSMYMAIALLDALVDGYFSAISAISVDVEALEEELGEGGADEKALMRIYALKRIVVALRNALIPAQQALGALHRNSEVEIDEAVEPFFADVKGHADQVVESVQALHDLLSGMLDLQISLAGMRMNNVMKFLTVIATIFIPLTFIVGIYGMNFEYMPELGLRYGYLGVMCLMAFIGGMMAYYFKKNRWL